MIFYDVGDMIKHIKGTLYLRSFGITSGCFDILHPLHIEYLTKCSRQCEKLYVLIDSDRLIYENKGKYPVFSESDRAYMISNLKSVNGVLVFDNLKEMEDILNSIGGLNIEAKIFKNSNKIYGQDLIKVMDLKWTIVPDVNKFRSSTEIKNFLKQQV